MNPGDLNETLRPTKLSQFIGQNLVKDSLNVFIQAAKGRGEPLSHVLIHGAPGLGKTTLAMIIAKEMGVNYRISSGPAIERPGDLAAILSNLEKGDIFFIDEIHRLSRSVEEVLYPAMEDFALDLVLGKGPSAKTLRVDVPKFTLIGATTRAGAISSPMRDRFGVNYQLDFYSDKDIENIIVRSATILEIELDKAGAALLAKRSRKTPRVANHLLQRTRDFAQVKGKGKIDADIAHKTLEMLSVDDYGLDQNDRKILKTIAEKFGGGPVGLKTLAAATRQDIQTLEEMIEPYLLQIGFLDRTPSGRKISSLGLLHIGKGEKPLFR